MEAKEEISYIASVLLVADLMNRAIKHQPAYVGHWRGEAWLTHHTYGVQAHRTRTDAERWIVRRVTMFGVEDLAAAPTS